MSGWQPLRARDGGLRAAARDGLGPVYALALQQTDLLERAADHQRCPEAAEVLDASAAHLWQAILAPDEAGQPVAPLAPPQKCWLLVHAGLLRGFNLALITAWRPSADSLDLLDELYPGFRGYGERLHTAVRAEAASLATSPGQDSRDVVDRVAARSRELIRLGLERGYGLGFLVDVALGAGPGPVSELASALRAATAPGRRDDPALAASAEAWAAELGRSGRRAVLAEALARPSGRRALEAAVADESRAHPLAVPANLARFSPAFLRTMLAYLFHWWLGVGVRLGCREATGAGCLPPAEACWRRYPVRHWTRARSLAWARDEADAVQALAGDPAALRWLLAEIAQSTAAVGWRLARRLEGARETSVVDGADGTDG